MSETPGVCLAPSLQHLAQEHMIGLDRLVAALLLLLAFRFLLCLVVEPQQ